MNVLAINAGSSSLRLSLFSTDGAAIKLCASEHYSVAPALQAELLHGFLEQSGRAVELVAHRLVHGGNRITHPGIIDGQLESDVEHIVSLAPLHNPAALALIRRCRDELGDDVVQVVVPDSGFYSSLPAVASSYALPGDLCEQYQIQRFGFHGIAHKAMLQHWQTVRPELINGGRVISLQLGAGCSVTAIHEGIVVDTSMGFTPLEGLVMATRCGDIDAAVVLYLQREAGYSLDDLERLLNHESGLLGLSGNSADMRVLLESDTAAAKLAVDLYCYRARKYIGSYLTVLGGADAILFGGGVGENSALIREKILVDMVWQGIEVDSSRNSEAQGIEERISTPESQTEIRVIAVDEGAVLAREAILVVEEKRNMS